MVRDKLKVPNWYLLDLLKNRRLSWTTFFVPIWFRNWSWDERKHVAKDWTKTRIFVWDNFLSLDYYKYQNTLFIFQEKIYYLSPIQLCIVLYYSVMSYTVMSSTVMQIKRTPSVLSTWFQGMNITPCTIGKEDGIETMFAC